MHTTGLGLACAALFSIGQVSGALSQETANSPPQRKTRELPPDFFEKLTGFENIVGGSAARPAAKALSSRAATIDYIQKTLTDFDVKARAIRGVDTADIAGPKFSPTASWYQKVIDDSLEQAIKFRDTLSTNPYIRVDSFTVVIPWGIEFQFKFVETPPPAAAAVDKAPAPNPAKP